MNKPALTDVILELHVPDFSKAKKFYSLFGFKELLHDPTSGGGSDMGYLVLLREDKIGNTSINFYGDKGDVSQHSHFRDFPKDTPRGYGVEITVPVSGVDGLWENVKDKLSAEQVPQKLTTKRWGKKDFRVIDPFGFYIRFTELVDWKQGEPII